MVMVRKQVYLPEALDKELAAEAKRRGISQAELIRMRLEAPEVTSDARPMRKRTPAQEAIVQETLAKLREIRARTKSGPGSGTKFNREELYAERIDRISSR